MEVIQKYFPDLTSRQLDQFRQIGDAYRSWNQRINVISRKDIDNLYLHHILHSLAIARVIRFKPGARVMDLGTGGGLPGVPLAILFPETRFTLIDSIRKKITVVEAVCQAAGIDNVIARQQRAEEVKEPFDFVVTRAVASLEKLIAWSFPRLNRKQQHALPNGLIALKGGTLAAEINSLPKKHFIESYPISDFFEEPFFQEKFVVYAQG